MRVRRPARQARKEGQISRDAGEPAPARPSIRAIARSAADLQPAPASSPEFSRAPTPLGVRRKADWTAGALRLWDHGSPSEPTDVEPHGSATGSNVSIAIVRSDERDGDRTPSWHLDDLVEQGLAEVTVSVESIATGHQIREAERSVCVSQP
jgi:hypothetical protein